MSSRPDSHGRDVEDVPNKAEYDVDHVEHDAVGVNTQGPLETKFAGVLTHTPVDILLGAATDSRSQPNPSLPILLESHLILRLRLLGRLERWRE